MIVQTVPPQLYLSLIAFADSRNMLEAGAKVGLSQPSLTNHLGQLERLIPQPLFEMVGRKKVLTPFGKDLVEVVRRNWTSLEAQVGELVQGTADVAKLRLRIAGRGEILRFFASRIQFPGRIEFVSADGSRAVDGVAKRTYDLAISSHFERADALYAKKIFADRFAIAAPKKRLSPKASVTEAIRQLQDFPSVAYRETGSELERLSRALELGTPPKPRACFDDWEALVHIVRNGRGWAIVPETYLAEREGLTTISVPEKFLPGTSFYLFYRSSVRTAPWLKELVTQFLTAGRS